MRLHRFELKQVCQFSSLTIDFASASADVPITVILGEQGSGKTNLLKHIFYGLSWFSARHKEIRSAGIIMADSDIRQSAIQATVNLTVNYPPELKELQSDQNATPKTDYVCSWQIKKIKSANASVGLSRTDTVDLDLLVPRYHKQLEHDPLFSTPCIAYYPVERFVSETNLQVKNISSLAPLHQAYDPAPLYFTTFTKFFEWLREVHDLENAQSAQLLRQYLDPNTRFHTQEQLDDIFSQLEHAYRLAPQRCLNSLRTAIHTVIPEIRDLYIEFQPRLRLMVNYQGENISFMQLSQTYRTWVALVGDIVRRVCILNPKSFYPCLEGEGIIIIDEIDAQLDQNHRQHILSRLNQAFPRLQFIVSGQSHDLLDEQFDLECYQLQHHKISKLDFMVHQEALQQIYQDMIHPYHELLSLQQQDHEMLAPTLDFHDVVKWAKALPTQERTQLFQELLNLPQQDNQV